MKGQLTRDEDGELWVYITPHHTGYWKFVDADDNWVDRGMALQVTGEAAALFAAAPELLTAIKQGLHQMEHSTGQQDLRALFRSVINKAEGRSE